MGAHLMDPRPLTLLVRICTTGKAIYFGVAEGVWGMRSLFSMRIRRPRLPMRLVMIVLSLLLLTGPLHVISSDSARAQPLPPLDLCISGIDTEGLPTYQPAYHRIVQNCQLRSAGLDDVEAQAIDDLLAMHQLPASDKDRVIGWERDAIRALIYTRLMEMIQKDPAERTQTEQDIVDQMAEIVKQRRIAAAQYSINEYTKWDNNPCEYVEPVDTDWEPDLEWCMLPSVQLTRGPISPTISEFLTYGQAHIYEDFGNDGPGFGAASNTALMIGLAAGMIATGIAAAVGAAVGGSISATSPLLLAIFPYLARALYFAATGVSTAAEGAIPAIAAGGTGAGAIGAAVGVIVFAIVVLVVASIQLAAQLAIPGQLAEALTTAQSGVDLRQLALSDGGKSEIFAAFIHETLPDYDSQTPVADAQSTDRTFVIEDSAGNKTHSQTLDYLCWNMVTACSRDGLEHQVRLHGGWFVDQDYATGAAGARRMTLGIDYIDHAGKGWTAWRVGPQQFLHTSPDPEIEPYLSNEIEYQSWDGGLYTATINQVPTVGATPSVSSTVNKGDFQVSWTAATDVDGDPVTYTLERCNPSIIISNPNDGTFGHQCSPIKSDLASLAHAFLSTAPEPEGQWTYRVRAFDGFEQGAYSSESSPVIVDRTAPWITFQSSTPTPNLAGWNKADVTVTWACYASDPDFILSVPVAAVVSESVTETVTEEGTGLSANGTCEDKAGNIATDTVSGINIDKTPPDARHGGPYVVDEGSTVQLLSSNSIDATSGISQMLWEIDGTSYNARLAYDFAGVDGPLVTPVKLTVTDEAGNQSIVSTTVTTNNVAPLMTNITADTALIAINQAFNVHVSATDVPADTVNFIIDCANGISNLIPGVSSTPGAFNATGNCSYATPGDYTIKSYATDDDGDSSAALLTATTIQIVTPKTLCINERSGAIHSAEACARGETEIVLPDDGALTMCVNQWNGSVRMSSNCNRSERPVTVIGDESVSVCVNKWNGAMRVSESCSRSELQEWL